MNYIVYCNIADCWISCGIYSHAKAIAKAGEFKAKGISVNVVPINNIDYNSEYLLETSI